MWAKKQIQERIETPIVNATVIAVAALVLATLALIVAVGKNGR